MAVIVKLLSKFDDSGIRRAKSQFGGLKKTIGAIGIGVGISQITDLLMDSAKAASADAKSTKILNTQLTRNAEATKAQIKQSNKFIEKLSLQTGILDDDLRPAYAKFANVTHNVKEAQKLLTITLDAAAGSGKSQTKIANAVAKAYDGNTTSLIAMFPELKKSKDVLGDFAKEYADMAEINADPFMKFNNSMDILKEKLGAVILPLLSDFVDFISKPGGPIDQVSKFLDSFQDPNSDASKMFTDIKNAVKDAFGYVKDFFALFGNGDAMKGFANVGSTLVKMLPALLALKAIMMLASTGKAIASLVTAMGLIQGKNAIPTGSPGTGIPPIITPGTVTPKNLSLFEGLKGIKVISFMKLAPMIGIGLGGDITNDINPTTGKTFKQSIADEYAAQNKANKDKATNNIINITVANADPKAVVDAIAKYVKVNGALPSVLTTGKYGR